jgi:hypothetical protein
MSDEDRLLVFGGGSWEIPQVFLLTIRQRLNSEAQKSFHSSSTNSAFTQTLSIFTRV